MAKKDKDEQLEIDLGVESQEAPRNILVDEPEAKEEIVVLQEDKDDSRDAIEDSIEELKSKLKDTKQRYKEEKKAREKAEIAAMEAAQKAYKASSEAEENQMHLVSGALDTLKREQEYIKNTMKETMAAGDFDRMVELQEIFQSNINKIARLEDGLTEMKNNPRREAPPAPAMNAVDDLMQKVTPKSAKWLDKNRDHLEDPRMLRIMARAHEDALDNSIIAESPEYFSFIENRLGINKSEKAPKRDTRYDEDGDDDVMSGASSATQRRYSAPAAAPVSRSSGGPSGNQRVVRLTPDQAEAARISGISPQEYWEHLQRERNRA